MTSTGENDKEKSNHLLSGLLMEKLPTFLPDGKTPYKASSCCNGVERPQSPLPGRQCVADGPYNNSSTSLVGGILMMNQQVVLWVPFRVTGVRFLDHIARLSQ